MQAYIATARQRQQQRQTQLQQRRQQGLTLAGVAAEILKHDFDVSRVVVFGSVLSDQTFHETSDLDLAVWGLPPERYLSAVAKLLNLSGFSIDLVPAETASPHLQAAIAKGLEL